MKTLVAATITFLSFIIISSCGVNVYFSEAQPPGQKNIYELPESVQGIYADGKDSLFIRDDHFVLTESSIKSYTMNEINESPDIMLLEGKIYDRNSHSAREGKLFEKHGDTIVFTDVSYPEYYFSDSIQLRKYNAFYVLSWTTLENPEWEVTLVEFTQDSVFLYYASTYESFDSMEEYENRETEYKKITDFTEYGDGSYLINPSIKEFDELYKAGLFKKTDALKKIEKISSYNRIY